VGFFAGLFPPSEGPFVWVLPVGGGGAIKGGLGGGGGGFQQIQLRTEDRENGDLGTVAP